MRKLIIPSKVHGILECLLDDEDYRMARKFGNGNGRWCVSVRRGKPYVQKRTTDGLVEIHRLITNAPKGMYVDHINGDTLDNRRRNLRVCTNSANLRNGKVRTHNTSGVTGVSWEKSRNKWEAYIKVNFKKIPLGRYSTLEDAIKARKQAEKKYWSV